MKLIIKLSIIGVLLMLLISSGCGNSYNEEELKTRTAALFDSLSYGDPYQIIPEKNFARESVEQMISDLRGVCKVQNREGNFINSFYQKRMNKPDMLTMIYEFHLACGDKRFLISYLKKEGKWELFEIFVEPASKENKMILNPERQLNGR